MKYFVVKFFCCCLVLMISTVKALALSEEDRMLIMKNFFFLYKLETPIQKLNKVPPPLEAIRNRLERDASGITKNCSTAVCYGSTLQFTDAEITAIGNELVHLVFTNVQFSEFVQRFKASGPYVLFKGEGDTIFVRKCWEVEARGINHILSVYIEGHAPLYPKIDSISFDKNDPAFRDQVAASVKKVLKYHSVVFYNIPMLLALEALRINGRNEAARYEPLREQNAAAVRQVKKIKWDAYPYSVILVPGLGPEQPGVALDPGGAKRCDSAAARYRAGKAPFIIVSGGHVHPNKTPYCEAVEMKKYLVNVLHIPDAAVIIEPCARHTTTNLRNANRLIYRFNIPADKRVLIVTDASQNSYINGVLRDRLIKELGYVPYSSMKKLSAIETEYIPLENSRQINSMEPLDP